MRNLFVFFFCLFCALGQAQYKLEQIRLSSSFAAGITPSIGGEPSQLDPVVSASVLIYHGKENLVQVIPGIGIGYYGFHRSLPEPENYGYHDAYYFKSRSIFISPLLKFRMFVNPSKSWYLQGGVGFEIPVYTWNYFRQSEFQSVQTIVRQNFFSKTAHFTCGLSAGYVFDIRKESFSVEAGYKTANRTFLESYYHSIGISLAWWPEK